MTDDLSADVTAGLSIVSEYWNDRAQRYSSDCEKVEWSLRSQRMRFETFLLFHDLNDKSVLDVGCGTGHFAGHLAQRNITAKYTGIDLSKEMILRCKELYPAANFILGNILDGQETGAYDFTVSFGIHNIKVPGGREILERMTRRQFELCTTAAHVSILTDRFSGFAPHIQPWRPEEILTLALNITPFVVLRHDYLPNDFSITLYRKPLIDSRTDLLLDGE